MDSIRDSKKHIQEYQPERVKPIYTYITKKYLSEENIATLESDNSNLNTLTFNVKESDPSMVLKSVRLCLPIGIGANSGDTSVSTRIADQMPACNLALAASAYEAFSDIQLIANGSCFSSQPNRYQGMLERVYRARDVLSYQSGGSLKPIVSRNLKTSTATNSKFQVQTDDEKQQYVQIHDTYSSVSRNAFDLTQSNPGFVTRAAKFQADMNGSNWLSQTLLEMYVDVGIFQNKERILPSGRRLYNDACPYLRDIMLRFTFDKLRSKFDAKYDTIQKYDNHAFANRDFPSKVLEFATPVNSSVIGENALPVTGWADSFDIYFLKRPYLECQYVQVPEQTLKPQYALMAIRHQHETSDVFNLNFTNFDDSGIVFPKVTQRLNSRLLEVPSKIYVWAGLSFNDKKSFFLGNTGNQRYCKIDRLHLRMNTRSDALFEPTQLECYNIFKRVSLNDMNYQTWSLSPIYVFDPQALGQPEFLASDGQLMTYEWDCEISPTAMQYNEMLHLQDGILRDAMGYDTSDSYNATFTLPSGQTAQIRKFLNWTPNPTWTFQGPAVNGVLPPGTHAPWGLQELHIPLAQENISASRRSMYLAYHVEREYAEDAHQRKEIVVQTKLNQRNIWTINTEGHFLHRVDGQIVNNAVLNVPEILRIHDSMEHRLRLDNFIWAIWDAQANIIVQNAGGQACFWYVPQTWLFSMAPTDIGYESSSGNWMHRHIFNSLNDIVWMGDGSISIVDAARPIDAMDDTGRGIVKGKVSLLTPWSSQAAGQLGGDIVMRDFNKLEAVAKGEYGPGPRAYPLAINGAAGARTFAGIRNIGMPDGGTNVANVNTGVRGGLRPERMIANAGHNSETYFKMIDPRIAAGAQQQYYWIAFQPSLNAMSGTNDASATFVAWNTNPIVAGDFVGQNAGNAFCGGVSTPLQTVVAAGAAGRIQSPKEVHVVKQILERGAAGSEVFNGNYSVTNENRGVLFESAGPSSRDQTVTDSLEWELNCLYEFGNERYIVSKQGQLVQDNDVWTPTVIQKRARVSPEQLQLPRSIPRDPRLQGMPKLERVKSEPQASGFYSHY